MNLFDPFITITDFKTAIGNSSLSDSDCERVLNFAFILFNSIVPINVDPNKVFKETVTAIEYQKHIIDEARFYSQKTKSILKRPITEMISNVEYNLNSNIIHGAIQNQVIEYKSNLLPEQKANILTTIELLYIMFGVNPPNFSTSNNMRIYQADNTKIEYFANQNTKSFLQDNQWIVSNIESLFNYQTLDVA
jgi:hypothetical protein